MNIVISVRLAAFLTIRMMEFPQETIQDITSALAKHSVIALCGPPGCGKWAILKHMGYEDSLDLDIVIDCRIEHDGVKPFTQAVSVQFDRN